jgi:hypothetical protein
LRDAPWDAFGDAPPLVAVILDLPLLGVVLPRITSAAPLILDDHGVVQSVSPGPGAVFRLTMVE